MNTHSLRVFIRNGIVILAAAVIGTSAISMAHANDTMPSSTVGNPPAPAPTSTVGDPPTLPAVLSYTETAIAPASMMNIYGIAFEDVNGNGTRDAGEPSFDGAWFKLSGGGNWFVCGNVMSNGVFGLPVKAGAYHIQPINVKGFRVTTPQIDVAMMGKTPAAISIGYARDANAVGESCDTYHPSRPLK